MAYSLKLRAIIELVEEIVNDYSTKLSYSFEQTEVGMWQFIIHNDIDLIARMMFDEQYSRMIMYCKFKDYWFDIDAPTFVSDLTELLTAAINWRKKSY